MRLVLSACSRLASFGLQPPARLVARPALLRRDFYIQTGGSLDRVSSFIAKAFHGPDEEDPSFEHCHLSFAPGEVFKFGDDEYRIERKLRGRLFSKVWLATHTNKRGPAKNGKDFVAFETFDSLFSESMIHPQNAGLRHVHDLKLRQEDDARGSEYCDGSIRVLPGPHLCVVKEPCGPALAALQEAQPRGSFTLPVAKRIIKQTLLALDFMHTTMEKTHVGVNHHNIQVALLGSKQQLMADIQDYLDSNPPQMVYRSIWDRLGLSGSEGGATMKAQTLPAFGLSPSLDNLEIRLGRCEYATLDKRLETLAKQGATPGEATVFTAFDEYHAPLLLAAPEAIRGWPRPYSPPINIWAVGHLLFQCLTGEIVYTKRVERMGREFPDYGEVYSLANPHALGARLRSFAHVGEEMGDRDVQATCALLSRCFDPDPAARPTAGQLLKDGWFQS